MKIDEDLITRFERRVTKLYRIVRTEFGVPVAELDRDGCWIWTGARTRGGYGHLTVNGRTIKAHRLAYRIHQKRWPPHNRVVAHSCDNRQCVNPHHLRATTHTANMHDAKQRQRLVAKGGKIPPLPESKREQIRKHLESGFSFTRIARMSDVSRKTVARIAKRG